MSASETGDAGPVIPPERRELAPLIENMLAPETYATFASGFSAGHGTVSIKLVSVRWDNSIEPAAQRAVVVGRLTMPVQGAQALVAGLQAFLAQHGLDQPAAPRARRATDMVAAT